jgi:multidrug resistance efflux pump
MSLITSEFNYQRKAHRVDLPMVAEIAGRSYRVRDWSMSGIGVLDLDKPLPKDQLIEAKCSLPMRESLITIKVTLCFKSRRGGVSGFEFHDISPKNKRILRHYIELAVEGKLDNIEDLISVATAPELNSPIEEALNLTELESEGLTKQFRARSYLSIGIGVIFFLGVLLTLFYNTVYRVTGTGVIGGNIERVTANANGAIKQISVQEDVYVAKGDTLFEIDDGEVGFEIAQTRTRLAELNEKLKELERFLGDDHGGVVASLDSEYRSKQQDLQNAKLLFERRVITRKDFNHIENQLRQAQINLERAKEERAARRLQVRSRIDDVRLEIKTYSMQLDELLAQAERYQIHAPVTGKIFRVEHTVGEYVTPNDIVVLIEKNVQPSVSMKLLSADALKIRIGMAATIYSPMLDRQFEAIVSAVGYSSINSASSLTQEASLNETVLKLELVDPDIRLPANSRVDVWIRTFELPWQA